MQSPPNSPKKRRGINVHINGQTQAKAAKSKNSRSTTMKVEGYAFHDDIVGVTHRRSDDEEAFNQ